MKAQPYLALAWAVMLVGCVTPGDVRQPDTASLVVTDQNLPDIALLTRPEYRFLSGPALAEAPGSEAWRRRATANALHTDYYRNRESASYRSRTDIPGSPRYPCKCLALSGGGMRSLAFSTGVLSALQQAGVYSQVDVVSAVSGGAYASYWTVSHVRKGATEEQILSGPDSPQLTRIRSRANGLTTAGSKVEFLFPLGGVEEQPLEIGSTEWYADFLGDIFLSKITSVEFEPAPQNRSYGNVLHRMLTDSSWIPAQFRSIESLQDFVKSGQAPLPVWLATARPTDLPVCVGTDPDMEVKERSRDLLWAAFEITPFRIGSEQLGFIAPSDFIAQDALAVSGAAMNIPYNARCKMMRFIDSSVLVKFYPEIDAITPAQFGGMAGDTAPDFVLIDGGMADNLAVFPLVRRLCSEIIIVDAEFDPHLVFPGYEYLKQQLARQGIQFEVPKLEELAARNRIWATSFTPDAHCDGNICLVRPKSECVLRDATAACITPDAVESPIFEGRIGPIPVAEPVTEPGEGERWTFGERTLRVRYVKLALDAATIDAYPATVRERYAEHLGRRESLSMPCTAEVNSEACSFPQESTADLDYRAGQFEAYWDLGRCTIERFWSTVEVGKPAARCEDSVWPEIGRGSR